MKTFISVTYMYCTLRIESIINWKPFCIPHKLCIPHSQLIANLLVFTLLLFTIEYSQVTHFVATCEQITYINTGYPNWREIKGMCLNQILSISFFLFGTDVSQSFFIHIIITITTTTKYSRSQTLLSTYIFYMCRSYVALLHI